jgi:hypothetical protein
MFLAHRVGAAVDLSQDFIRPLARALRVPARPRPNRVESLDAGAGGVSHDEVAPGLAESEAEGAGAGAIADDVGQVELSAVGDDLADVVVGDERAIFRPTPAAPRLRHRSNHWGGPWPARPPAGRCRAWAFLRLSVSCPLFER